MTDIASVLADIQGDLEESGRPFALIGGLAVSVHAEPRFTRDVDLAVAVDDDTAAEALVADLQRRGWVVRSLLEQDETGRLAAVRLSRSASGITPVVDLLFASSGIEGEVVAAATRLDVLPGIEVPVASAGHLIALKLLAAAPGRPQDLVDLQALVHVAAATDLDVAAAATSTIVRRGYGRGRDLALDLRRLLDAADR